MNDEYCWNKYGDLLRINIEWFTKRGKHYRRTPWKHYLLDKYLRGKVLDIGCGYASTTRYYFFNRGSIIQLVLLDIVGEVLEELENDKNLLKIVSDALTLPFEKKYFDTVYMQAFLHNIPGKECRLYLLRNVWEVLKGQGVLIITVWSPDLNILKKKYIVKEIGMHDIIIKDKWGQRYYHIYDLQELIEEVSTAGFSMIKYDYFIQNPSLPELTKNIIVVFEKRIY